MGSETQIFPQIAQIEYTLIHAEQICEICVSFNLRDLRENKSIERESNRANMPTLTRQLITL